MKVAIAGAFGFIGQHLIQHFLENTDHEIIAISRSPREADDKRVLCVTADLYSLKEVSEALVDCDVAIYLVHSMAPSSRLSQGHFRDFDFILADNFGRAAVINGIKQIAYVGGMIPERKVLSPHLQSRLEVEEVLRSHNIPLTVFRCGLVIGHKASSFSIIVRLAERLPIMVLPQWMRTLSNPIYVGDLVSLIGASLAHPATSDRVIDAGMDESVSYKDIVIETARIFEKTPKFIDVPYVSPHLSKLWVRLVSGAPKSLVYPLIDSVRHEMLKDPSRAIPSSWGVRLSGLVEAIKKTLELPFVFRVPRLLSSVRELSEVRSVQRIPLPIGKDALWVADRYVCWLPFYIKPFLRVIKTGVGCEYRMRFFGLILLTLNKDLTISKPNRQLFRVGGGLLVADGNQGRFEFRESHNRKFLIVALHNFRPALPWLVYRFTQAFIHRLVMERFGRVLGENSD